MWGFGTLHQKRRNETQVFGVEGITLKCYGEDFTVDGGIYTCVG